MRHATDVECAGFSPFLYSTLFLVRPLAAEVPNSAEPPGEHGGFLSPPPALASPTSPVPVSSPPPAGGAASARVRAESGHASSATMKKGTTLGGGVGTAAAAASLGMNPAHAYVVRSDDGLSWTVPPTLLVPFEPVQAAEMSDLAALSSLTEASVLHLLRERFFLRHIYSYSGTTLVSINPFQELPHLYSAELALRYEQTGVEAAAAALAGTPPDPALLLAPHVWRISDNAYRDLIANGRSQSIVIGGESGAGQFFFGMCASLCAMGALRAVV